MNSIRKLYASLLIPLCNCYCHGQAHATRSLSTCATAHQITHVLAIENMRDSYALETSGVSFVSFLTMSHSHLPALRWSAQYNTGWYELRILIQRCTWPGISRFHGIINGENANSSDCNSFCQRTTSQVQLILENESKL